MFDQVSEGPQPVRIGPGRGDTLVLPSEEYAGRPLRFDVRRDGAVELQVPAGVDVVLAPGGSARPMPPNCYEKALRDQPDLDGKVAVRFTVGTAGTVTDAHVIGATGEFAGCIRHVLLNARGLPILAAPAQFSHAYVFSKN